jgi:hypothetical protein
MSGVCEVYARQRAVVANAWVALAVPRCHPDINVLDLHEAFYIDSGVIGGSYKCLHGFIGFEFVLADLKLRGWSLKVEDGLPGEEATRGLLVMLG